MERIARHGEALFKKARDLGWKDNGEGPIEFLMRKAAEQAAEAAWLEDMRKQAADSKKTKTGGS